LNKDTINSYTECIKEITVPKRIKLCTAQARYSDFIV